MEGGFPPVRSHTGTMEECLQPKARQWRKDSPAAYLGPMSSEIILSDTEEALERLLDSFFDARTPASDWEAFLRLPETLLPDEALAELQSMEPLQSGKTDAHRFFVLQQRLRLGLRHRTGLHLQGPEICAECGKLPWDPVLCRCLPCEEKFMFRPYLGNRGACRYLRPTYDTRSRSWGLLYYNSRQSDDPVMFFAVVGFTTLEDAAAAVAPSQALDDHLSKTVRGQGAPGCLADLVDPIKLFEMKLPLAPGEWRVWLRGALGEKLQQYRTTHRWSISEALRDYERQISDRV